MWGSNNWHTNIEIHILEWFHNYIRFEILWTDLLYRNYWYWTWWVWKSFSYDCMMVLDLRLGRLLLGSELLSIRLLCCGCCNGGWLGCVAVDCSSREVSSVASGAMDCVATFCLPFWVAFSSVVFWTRLDVNLGLWVGLVFFSLEWFGFFFYLSMM